MNKYRELDEALHGASFVTSLSVQSITSRQKFSEDFMAAAIKESARFEAIGKNGTLLSDDDIIVTFTGLFSNAFYAWTMATLGPKVVKQQFDGWVSRVGSLMSRLPEMRSAEETYAPPEVRL